jgi:hypothetical protein
MKSSKQYVPKSGNVSRGKIMTSKLIRISAIGFFTLQSSIGLCLDSSANVKAKTDPKSIEVGINQSINEKVATTSIQVESFPTSHFSFGSIIGFENASVYGIGIKGFPLLATANYFPFSKNHLGFFIHAAVGGALNIVGENDYYMGLISLGDDDAQYGYWNARSAIGIKLRADKISINAKAGFSQRWAHSFHYGDTFLSENAPMNIKHPMNGLDRFVEIGVGIQF